MPLSKLVAVDPGPPLTPVEPSEKLPELPLDLGLINGPLLPVLPLDLLGPLLPVLPVDP